MACEGDVIELSDDDRRALRELADSSQAPARRRLRARIVLRAAERASNAQIAAELGTSSPTVALWRRRFVERGLGGLGDAPRAGRPRKAGTSAAQLIRSKLSEPPPDGDGQWSVRRLAAATGLSPTTVHRVQRELRDGSPPERSARGRSAPGLDGALTSDGDGRPSTRRRTARARRELIRRSAAAVIAERGFAGTTMALVARKAGVSTGMLNHYFPNRSDMLTQTLEAVSDAMLARVEREIAGAEPGLGRFEALLRAWLPNDPETIETWRVWLAAYGETVSDEHLRETIESRLKPWHALLGEVLDGVAPDRVRAVPLSWQLNAFVNGLVIQALAAKPQMTLAEVRGAVLEFVDVELGDAQPSTAAASALHAAAGTPSTAAWI
jgi:AcrR family transcriptional regulator/transposase